MNERFSETVAGSMPNGDRRRQAASALQHAELPNTETEEWRYSPIGELPLDELQPSTAAPDGHQADLYLDEAPERAATVVVVDGWVVDIDLAPGWAEKGVTIEADSSLSSAVDDGAVEAASSVEESTMFDLLHQAFCPAAVVIKIPTGLSVREPIVVVNHHQSVGVAAFSHLVIDAADGSDVSVLERQTSSEGFGLSVPVVDLRVGPAARVRYQSIQELDRRQWQLARQRSTVAGQATLSSGVAAFGARYARQRTDSRLQGRGASAGLVAAYYGDGDQVHDFRTFQHHDARDTRSDMLFKGAQDDASGSIYTGMIHIHPDGAGSNAFQTNRNVKLSPDAWAWSVPNLEIENNDVHCSHASTVSPVDEDQQFYLQSRGVAPVVADRLIVAGFFDEAIDRMPVPVTGDAVRRQVAAKLDVRDRS